MEDHNISTQEQDDNTTSSSTIIHTNHQGTHLPEEHEHPSEPAARLLDRADTFIYAIVGACFLLGALLALGYTFWDFGVQAFMIIPHKEAVDRPGFAAEAIIQFVSG